MVVVTQIDKQRYVLSTDSIRPGQYREMLCECAEAGDWRGALLVYASMLKWDHPVEEYHYRHILRCCRVARPVRADVGKSRSSRGTRGDAVAPSLVV